MNFDLYDERDAAAVCRAFARRPVGLTSGSYDLKHSTQESYLCACRRILGPNGVLIVGVDSDQQVRERKGEKRPILPEMDRLISVTNMRCVDAAFILGSAEDFGLAAKLLKVKFIFKNQDYANVKVYGSDLPGVKLMIVPDIHRLESTTEIVENVITRFTQSS